MLDCFCPYWPDCLVIDPECPNLHEGIEDRYEESISASEAALDSEGSAE